MRRIFWKRMISGKLWKRVISGMQLAEGYQIPRGWGISYIKWEADFYVIHPIPLNYIIAGMRWLLHKISVPCFVNLEKERILKKSFESYNRGWDDHVRHVEYMTKQKWRECAEETIKRFEELQNEEAKHLNEKNKSNGL